MKRNTRILLILGSLVTIGPFSIDMYLPAFQKIADDLGTSVQRVALSLSSYFVGLALGQILYGPFLDRFGRKRPLYFGLSLYIVASLACMMAHSVEALVAVRFFQAIGGCAASVASVAMVRDFFPPQESARVFSKMMLILGVSPMFAPTVGSLVVGAWSWQAVFLSLAGITATILLVVYRFLPEGHQPDPAVSLHPMAILRGFREILRNRRFVSYALAGAFSFSGLFGYLAGSSSIFMGKFGLSEKQFGLVFAILSVGIIGGGQVNVRLSRRWSSEQIFKVALHTQVILAMVFLAGSIAQVWGLAAHMLLLFGYLSCVGLTYPNAAAIALAPFSRNAGSAASLLGFIQMSAGALASALFGFIPFEAALSVSVLFLVTSTMGVTFYRASARFRAHSVEAA